MSFKDLKFLDVYCCDEKAGVLKRTDFGSEFEFTKNFVEQKKSLSFHIKSQAAPISYYGDNLPAFFAGLLPEGLRLKSLFRKLKTSEDDLFSLLAAVGESCIGDVHIKNKESFVVEGVIEDLKKTDFYSLFQNTMESSNFYKNDEAFAGVQEKISASMINFPLNVAKSDKFYILKLNPKDKPRLIENEFASLELAKKCGLAVNKSKIVKDKNGNKGLLVERFDRSVKNGKIEMLHQEDACQFLNRYPADKYRLSLKEVAEGVQRYSTAPKIEMLRLIELYAFSYLTGNGDLHGKNISLQTLLSQKVTLTPYYDLMTTYIYKDHKMALKINGRDDNIKRKDLVGFAQNFKVPEKAVMNMLNKILFNIKKHHDVMHGFMDAKQIKQWQKMFEKRCEDLS